jgi:hypothetical protein
MVHDVIIERNKVTFTFMFYNGKSTVVLKERYLVLEQNRWNFEIQDLTHYFIKHGVKGCYLGECKAFGLKYDIWDLSKVFPNVMFQYNREILDKYKEF